VEELFLRPLLVGDELDVVDEEQVDPAVAGPELVDLALLDRGDELVRELLARRVDDPFAGNLAITWLPIACIRWVLPRPTPPYRNSGL
jgi:hypothetical protein